MSQNVVIEVKDVRKNFKVYDDKSKNLREKVIFFHKRNKFSTREVLKGISFNVKKGEAIGLIGKNGCGKSTTLKLLTRILRPNSGTIDIKGRVCSLIELGAGFHPDMSGRENIYINASIFGIKAKEVDERINDIIRFSELEEYIDNPVRTYSSGMYMRLAFSVAINVDADILLIDEILAVGDSAFQTKCFNKLMSLKEEGTTIVIVSHSLGQIEQICDRAIWIESGLIKAEGNARKICNEYSVEMELKRRQRALQEMNSIKSDLKNNEIVSAVDAKKMKNISCFEISKQCGPDARREGSWEAKFTSVRVLNSKNEETLSFYSGEQLNIEMLYEANDPNLKLNFVVGITRDDWVYCNGSTCANQTGFLSSKDSKVIRMSIPSLNLLSGRYYVDVRIQGDESQAYDVVYCLFEIEVKNRENQNEAGMISLSPAWSFEKI